MKTLERVMRVMTHVNIGSAIAMVTWIAWSGVQVVDGRYPKPEPHTIGAASPVSEPHLTHWRPCCVERAAPPATDASHHRQGRAHRELKA